MLFNSYLFLFIFMPISLIAYRLLLTLKTQRVVFWLLIASLLFYSYWDWKNLFVLIPSIGFNFLCGKLLEDKRFIEHKKLILAFSIASNLFILAYFKYSDFIVGELASFLNISSSFKAHHLPLGISFFTFTQIAYLIDIYYRKTKPSSFDSYALFVTYFPHLIAGPLLHHKPMIEQFEKKFDVEKLSYNISLGSTIFIIGLFKKSVIADYFAIGADAIFNLPAAQLSQIGTFHAWYGALCYTFQLYFDFSGYSDMAVGLSRFFGISLPVNFNSPYQAVSITDFWRRWHISLSGFLRNYLYIPLGGSREGFVKKLANLMIVMIVCGIWHGAGYTFAIWGVYHGILLCAHNIWQTQEWNLRLPHFYNRFLEGHLSLGLTFLCVLIGWVIFRSPNLMIAKMMLSEMFSFKINQLASLPSVKKELYTFFGAIIILFYCPNSQEICRLDLNGNETPERVQWWHWQPNLIWSILLSLMLLLSLYQMNEVSSFLYFQF